MAKRRGAGSEVSCEEGAQCGPCCVPPLHPQSLTSVWVFSLLPLPVLPSEHCPVAFTSATRDGVVLVIAKKGADFQIQEGFWG